MSAANGSAATQDPAKATVVESKGKGKATEEPVDQPMDEDDDDSSDEDEVSSHTLPLYPSCLAPDLH